MFYDAPRPINPVLSMIGAMSRRTPYFRGKWRLVDFIFGHFQKQCTSSQIIGISGGLKINCELWDAVQNTIWWLGVHEFRETRYLKSVLKPEMVFIDVGANVGFYSLVASSLVGGKGRVHAFEPAERTFSHLCANIERNALANIIPNRLALSDAHATMTLHLGPPHNSGTASLANLPWLSDTGEPVETVTLDAYLDGQSCDRLDVIKIDTEGHELSVLKGAARTLAKYKPILMIEILETLLRHAGHSRDEVYSYLDGFGYKPFALSNRGKLSPLRSPHDGNLIVFKA